MGLVASPCSLLAHVVGPACVLAGWMVSSWGSRTAGQDGGSLQSCTDTQEQVAGHQGMPWATEGFPLPVHPGLMSCQGLLQMQSYSCLKLGMPQRDTLARSVLALGENLVSATPSWPSPFKLCFFLAAFLGEEVLMVLHLFCVAGRGWGEGRNA